MLRESGVTVAETAASISKKQSEGVLIYVILASGGRDYGGGYEGRRRNAMFARLSGAVRLGHTARGELRRRRKAQARERAAYRARLPKLEAFDRRAVEALETVGAFQTSLEELRENGIDAPFDLAASRAVMEKPGRQVPYPKNYHSLASDPQLRTLSQEILWGLQERFLAIAENYIGLPVAYRGLVMRRDFADGQKLETRLWHLDAEDTRIMKIIVYLNDVGEDGGPFRFLPKSLTPQKGIRLVNDRLPDEVLDGLVPPDSYVKAVGPAGTVLIADPAVIWHHGCVPVSGDRLTSFFAYNSQLPLRPQHCNPMFTRAYLGPVSLTPRQEAAIDYRYPVSYPAAA
jgi:hypothetical protein